MPRGGGEVDTGTLAVAAVDDEERTRTVADMPALPAEPGLPTAPPRSSGPGLYVAIGGAVVAVVAAAWAFW